jgi:hypothetical protein
MALDDLLWFLRQFACAIQHHHKMGLASVRQQASDQDQRIPLQVLCYKKRALLEKIKLRCCLKFFTRIVIVIGSLRSLERTLSIAQYKN